MHEVVEAPDILLSLRLTGPSRDILSEVSFRRKRTRLSVERCFTHALVKPRDTETAQPAKPSYPRLSKRRQRSLLASRQDWHFTLIQSPLPDR
jgi:hypothetical protein